MIALLATLAMLLVGPAIVARAEQEGRLRAAVDGFIFVTISGLVVLDILPHLLEEEGWTALFWIALGLWGPSAVEHRFHAAARSTHLVVVLVAALGLVVHSMADGAVLSDGDAQGLAIAVVLHTLPVAMAVWWLLRPVWGLAGPSLMLLAMAAATLGGYLAGRVWLVDNGVGGIVESLVTGSILHVVFNRPHLDPDLARDRADPMAEGSGNILGLIFIAIVYGWILGLPETLEGIADQLLELALIAAPAVLLGYFLAGLISGLIPIRSMAWIGRGSTARQSLNGMLVGLPMPVCSCGVVPLYRSLIRRGVPPAAGLSFLVATPELGLDALIISLPLLGLDMTLARVVAAAVIAWTVGALLGRWVNSLERRDSDGCGHCHVAPDDAAQDSAGWSWAGARRGLRYGLTELVDATLPWLLLGLLIAALVAPFLRIVPSWELPGIVEIAAFALLGLPVYVCATGSTPIVAVMLVSGVSPGAAIAFLITGPATNPATFGVLSNLHGRRAALAFGVAVSTLAILAGVLTNAWPGLDLEPQILEQAHGAWWQQLALLVLLLILLSALLRRGARALIAELRGTHA